MCPRVQLEIDDVHAQGASTSSNQVKLMLGVGSPGSLHTATSAISEAYKTCCQASHLQR